MTKRDADALIDLLVAAFPSAKATPSTIALTVSWLMALRVQDGRRAVETLVGTSTFWPTIAEIRDAAGIPLAAVPQLIEARSRGVELVPDLGSHPGDVGTGWALAGEEAIPLSSIPARIERAALPAGEPDPSLREQYRERLAGFVAARRGGGAA